MLRVSPIIRGAHKKKSQTARFGYKVMKLKKLENCLDIWDGLLICTAKEIYNKPREDAKGQNDQHSRGKLPPDMAK